MPERVRVRNTVARCALMRKGGAHLQSSSGIRQQAKITLDDAIDEWQQSQQAEAEDGELLEADMESFGKEIE